MDASGSACEIRVLGPFTVLRAGQHVDVGGPKPSLLLALLAAEGGHDVSVDSLIDGLWADDPPATARKAVQVHVSNLRKSLDGGVSVETTASGYRLDRTGLEIDQRRFERLVQLGADVLETDPAAALAAAEEALGLWHGPAFGDFRECERLRVQAVRLDDIRLEARTILLDASLRLGRHAAAAVELEALVVDHPLDEELRRLHILALYRSGRQTDALRSYEQARRVLLEEFGLEPGRQLRELERRILEQDVTLDAPAVEQREDVIDAEPGEPSWRILGRYELRAPIGTVGAAERHLAYDGAVGREVVVSVFPPALAGGPQFVRGFDADAELLAGLDHPDIVPVIDHWRDPSGGYLVTPRRGLRRMAHVDGADGLEQGIRQLERIGAALAYAHECGVVHGRLDADAVALEADGDVALADFMTAAEASSTGVRARMTVRHDVECFLALVDRWLGDHLVASSSEVAEHLDEIAAARLRRLVGEGSSADATPPPLGRVLDLLRAVLGDAAHSRRSRRNPFKGLLAFSELDAPDYFGRDDLVEQVLGMVSSRRITAVVGPSGTGKSSAVRAGVLPRLRRDGLAGHGVVIVEMYPGSHPFEELESALVKVAAERPAVLLDVLTGSSDGLRRTTKALLPDDGSELVLVIDQFEELFSLTTDESVRRRFVESLVAITDDSRSRVRTLLTIRADFFDRPLEYAALGAALADGLVTVAMPDEPKLAQAIEGPAERVGLAIEPGLVRLVLRDVVDQPGALPLLQYALTEMFDTGGGDVLTVHDYEQIGGVAGAVARRAEEIFQSLTHPERAVAEELFVRLVSVGEDTDDTRRRIRQAELQSLRLDPSALEQVLGRFGTHRLLSFDRDPVTRGQTIEIAHESLIHQWPRFRRWIGDRRAQLVVLRRLEVAADEWDTNDREPSYLFGGGRLAQYEHVAESSRVRPVDRSFLEASWSAEHRREALVARRRRRVASLVGSLLVVALVVATIAVVQARRADQAASTATELRMAADRRADDDFARSLAFQARQVVEDDPELAALLAAGAAQYADGTDSEIMGALWHSTLRQPIRSRFVVGTPYVALAHSVAVSPDGSRALSTRGTTSGQFPEFEDVGEFDSSDVIDLATGETVAAIDDPDVRFATWDAARDQIVTLERGGAMSWRDPETGSVIERRSSDPLWHVELTERHIGQSRILDPECWEADISETDGCENTSGRSGRSITSVVDRQSGETIVEVSNASWNDLSPGGRWVLTVTVSAELVIHDLATGEEVARVDASAQTPGPGIEGCYTAQLTCTYPELFRRVGWSGDDELLWQWADGSVVRIDPSAGGALSEPIAVDDLAGLSTTARLDWPGGIEPSPDGRLVAVAEIHRSRSPTGLFELGAAIRVLDGQTFDEIVTLHGHRGIVAAMAWSLDGRRLVTTENDGTTIAWDLERGLPVDPVDTASPPTGYHGRVGGLQLIGTGTGAVRLWDPSTGKIRMEREGLPGASSLTVAVHEPEGLFALPAAGGVQVHHVDRPTEPRPVPMGALGDPVAFSEDGAFLLASTADGSGVGTVLIEVATGEVVWEYPRLRARSGAFLDEGDAVLVVGDHRVFVLDTATREIEASSAASGVRAAAVSADGRRAAIGSAGRLQVLDLAALRSHPSGGSGSLWPDGEPTSGVVSSTEVGAAMVDLEFSADGSVVLGTVADGSLRAWDGDDLTERWRIDGDVAPTELTWRGDGVELVRRTPAVRAGVFAGVDDLSGTAGWVVIKVPLDQQRFGQELRSTVPRGFTDAECEEYFSERRCPA